MDIKVVLEPCDEGGYTVYVPSLPGCISEGDTRDEALANIREAIELYLEPLEDDYISHPPHLVHPVRFYSKRSTTGRRQPGTTSPPSSVSSSLRVITASGV